jgi:GR25 family glycosyltransferase involved in LPS biosynthesis
MTRSEIFKNVNVISLPHRFDRRAAVSQEMSKHNISFVFFDAINGHELNYNGPLKKGEEGVRQSHLRIFQDSISTGQHSVMIFEDDVILHDELNVELDNALASTIIIPDMLYLGASHHIEPIHVVGNLYKVNYAFTAHAVYISAKIFPLLIELINNNPHLPVDVIYANIHKNIEAYAIYPHLAWQLNSYSDIQNEFVDYSFLKNEFVRFR